MQVFLDLSSQRYIFISPGVQQFTCCPREGNNKKKTTTYHGEILLCQRPVSNPNQVSQMSPAVIIIVSEGPMICPRLGLEL